MQLGDGLYTGATSRLTHLTSSHIHTHHSRDLQAGAPLDDWLSQCDMPHSSQPDVVSKGVEPTFDRHHSLHQHMLVRLDACRRSSSYNIHPQGYFEDVTASVSEARDQLQDVLTETWTNISLTVSEVDVLLPKTRAGFLRYSRKITLDPNTARTGLLLSEGNRKVTISGNQSCSSHTDRFTNGYQVLSTESLTGRCYWEVEWRGIGVYVAVAYKNITRAGSESLFGLNDKSWMLDCNRNHYIFVHNKVQSSVSGPQSSRIGVYLDHSAGILSFYSISKTMRLLHRIKTTFTQPLYAGLWLYYGSYGDTAEFSKVK